MGQWFVRDQRFRFSSQRPRDGEPGLFSLRKRGRTHVSLLLESEGGEGRIALRPRRARDGEVLAGRAMWPQSVVRRHPSDARRASEAAAIGLFKPREHIE